MQHWDLCAGLLKSVSHGLLRLPLRVGDESVVFGSDVGRCKMRALYDSVYGVPVRFVSALPRSLSFPSSPCVVCWPVFSPLRAELRSILFRIAYFDSLLVSSACEV